MPCDFAMSAALRGGTRLPVSFPSVSSTTTFCFAWLAVEELDRETDRVADHRARAGHPDAAPRRSSSWHSAWSRVKGACRCGAVAEDQQADAVALAPRDEVREHQLHARRAAPACVPCGSVKSRRAHRARDVHRQQQVASRLGLLDRRLDELGARGRGHEQDEHERATSHCRSAFAPRPRPARACARGRGDPPEEGHAQRGLPLLVGGGAPQARKGRASRTSAQGAPSSRVDGPDAATEQGPWPPRGSSVGS